MNPLTTAVILLTAISGVCGDDWPGFRGLERQGCCGSAAGPLHWSPTQNVAWKTPIPGRGHSSPIVSGDAIYLTTAYERARSDPIRSILLYATSAVALVLMMAGIYSIPRSVRAEHGLRDRIWRYARLLLFVQLLVGVAVVTLVGRHLLNPGGDVARQRLISVALALSCVMLVSLSAPARSRWYLATGLFSCVFMIPAYLTLRQAGDVFAVGSAKDAIGAVIAVSPLLLGLVLLAIHLVRRRQEAPGRNHEDTASRGLSVQHFLATGSIGFLAGVAPFFLLLYRAADYHMPDSYVWDTRVQPDIGWWWVGVFATLSSAALAGCMWRLVRCKPVTTSSLQQVFFVAALALAALSPMRAGLLEKPREFIHAIVCVHPKNGEVLWVCEGLVGPPMVESRIATHASATPVTDGERVFGYFGEDGLMCASSTGELLWTRKEPIFCSKFGVGTSPVLKDNVLVIVSDTRESDRSPSFIVAFDATSGQCLWKKERRCPILDASYATPLVRSWNGRQVVLVHGWYDVKGYDLQAGEELWCWPMLHKGRHLVASLVSDAERLYVTGAKQVVALDLSRFGTGGDPILWSTPIAGEKSSTPVVVNGRMFLVAENGMAFCLETQTGKMLWKQRLGGAFLSSVVAVADRVLFTSESGYTTVAAVGGEFRQLAKNTLNEPVYASLVPMANRLLARTAKGLHCLEDDR
ncbi:MAG: PQQ-binding-like beta-propeller repeat protein [Sedimentisphaerales bacterium]|nr:PQQ-binding-like beta-propeller repeat protein [Sedimentisphaerales bacterium]